MRLPKHLCFQKSPNYFQGNVEHSLRLQLPIRLLITLAVKFAWYWKSNEGPFDGICLPIMELPSNYAHFQKSPAFTTKSNILHKRMELVFTFLLGPKLPIFLPLVFHLIVEEYGIFMGYVGYMRGPSLAGQYCTQLAMVGIGKYRWNFLSITTDCTRQSLPLFIILSFFISFFSSANFYVYFYPSWFIFSLHIDQILNEATFVIKNILLTILFSIWYLFRVGTVILTSEVGVAQPFTFWRWSLPEK